MLSAPDTLRLRTAENVGIDYRIAGLGSRMLARLVDELVLLPVEIILLVLAGAVLPRLAGSAQGQAMGQLLTVALLIFVRALYFILLEWGMGGQTPGKRALSVRVVRAAGGGIGFPESLIRNLVRMFEELLICVPPLVSMFFDPRSRRLGDFAAATIVVHERRPSSGGRDHVAAGTWPVQAVPLHISDGGPPLAGIGALGQREHSFLRAFLVRQDLHPMQRHRLAAEIAAKLCERMAVPGAGVERGMPPELLLERLYLQLSVRLGARP